MLMLYFALCVCSRGFDTFNAHCVLLLHAVFRSNSFWELVSSCDARGWPEIIHKASHLTRACSWLSSSPLVEESSEVDVLRTRTLLKVSEQQMTAEAQLEIHLKCSFASVKRVVTLSCCYGITQCQETAQTRT